MKRFLIPLVTFLILQGCGGGSSSETATQEPVNNSTDTSTPDASVESHTSSASDTSENNTTSSIENTATLRILNSKNEASRFLNQGTFGASSSEIDMLIGGTRSNWIKTEFDKNISYHLPLINSYKQKIDLGSHSLAFWKKSITADDQLRQRMAFALSQIFVVSDATNDELEPGGALGYYMDILVDNAFGNYQDLLEKITYSPAMGHYLTYMYNEKSNPETGQRPDENYAREVMQLFSIGLLELNLDGSVKRDQNGNTIETYTNEDIKGLAKVFTGLVLDESKVISVEDANDSEMAYNPEPAWMTPMIVEEEMHSLEEKTFLGYTIPANTQTTQSIKLALEHLSSHNNVAPFISRQLIQRFTTSHPSASYIERVATAFKVGSFTLEDGTKVGSNNYGDLKATLAAILLDEEAISPADANRFGKIKEPILRFTQWARAFELKEVAPEYLEILYDTSEASQLNQHPFRSTSVFNFYRPGYIAPKTMSGDANMTAPELQITNATSIVGYANFMSYFIFGWGREQENVQDAKADLFSDFDEEIFLKSFIPTYTAEIALANKPTELLDHLNTLLCDGRLRTESQQAIMDTISELPVTNDAEKFYRVAFAIFMVLNSPEFMVQS